MSSRHSLRPIGQLGLGPEGASFEPSALVSIAERFREPCAVVSDASGARVGVAFGGTFGSGDGPRLPLLASLAPLYPEWLGDRSFAEVHRVRFPYVSGAMANGIATARLVIEMARAGFLGFFGAAGLNPDRVEAALDTMHQELGKSGHASGPVVGGMNPPAGAIAPLYAYGANLIHSPQEPELEAAIAALYLKHQVRRIEASAYMRLTPPIVRYAYSGLWTDPEGHVHRKNHVFAKVSRPEVARRFLEPAPAEILRALVERGELTEAEAQLGAALPVAEDITAEADSGGHTDNQALSALFPTLSTLRDEIAQKRGYRRPIRLGAAGGLGTPASVAAAFSMGAAYVLTGSVNQACVESGLHAEGKKLLAQCALGDFVMAPAADMFELGVEVQVLQRGTLFANRAKKLYELYRAHASLEDIRGADRGRLEQDILRSSLSEAWTSTQSYWRARDPREIDKAAADPKHKMALVFRSYLGQASRWAIAGDLDRKVDYQIWCGPAMGAFNAWTAGSFLASPDQRGVVQVARNLIEGAAALTRAQQLRSAGVPMPAAAFDFRPRLLS